MSGNIARRPNTPLQLFFYASDRTSGVHVLKQLNERFKFLFRFYLLKYCFTFDIAYRSLSSRVEVTELVTLSFCSSALSFVYHICAKFTKLFSSKFSSQVGLHWDMGNCHCTYATTLSFSANLVFVCALSPCTFSTDVKHFASCRKTWASLQSGDANQRLQLICGWTGCCCRHKLYILVPRETETNARHIDS